MKIRDLELHTSNLRNLYEFYHHRLGFSIANETEHSFTLQLGYSNLKFHQSRESKPYHIAFHIGANQEQQALEWLKKRVPILKSETHEIVDFPAWNAKSIYFYDPDKNIIEFISREQLHPSETSFSEKSVVGIAEIGLSTQNIEEIFRFLNKNFDLELYFGAPEVFCAIGDEDGLLITVDKDQKTWFPTNDKAFPADFDLKFEHQGKLFEVNYGNGELSVM